MTDSNSFLITACSAFLLITLLLFFYYRGKAILMFFQQEEYDSPRFFRWIASKGAFDKRATVLIFLVLALKFTFYDTAFGLPLYLFLLGSSFFIGFWVSRKHLIEAKKALVMTSRAKRIFGFHFFLLILAIYTILSMENYFSEIRDAIIILVFLQTPPIFIILANTFLTPFEKRIKAGYVKEAKEKIKDLNLVIIGITGSYGKTSTKHILAHILSSSSPTLATPGSVNTEMGICRIIRENLDKNYKFFIAEMGAYGEGSIAKLCDLCPPNFGLITGIGVAHYERFKTIETVFNAKFELADAVKETNGKTLVNTSTIPQNLLNPRLKTDESLIPVATLSGEEGDIRVLTAFEKRDGLHIEVEIKGEVISIFAPIYGVQQAGNIALSIALAFELGYPLSTIKAALKTLGQTNHRQEVTLSKSGPSVIDDAYNSNPTGFMSALNTLDMLGTEGGKRILITPGMVELGLEHNPKHLEVGRHASTRVDIALVVTPNRIPTFIEGLKEGNAQIETFETQEKAETRAKSIAGTGDVILFENNLPDLFESDVKF